MVELYRASIKNAEQIGVLSHLGSMDAAIGRVTSIQAIQQIKSFDKYGDCIVYNQKRQPLYKQTYKDALVSFADYMDRVFLSKFSVNFEKPLRLNDCWMDDPIGSGGPDIILDNTSLTDIEKNEIAKLFKPFSSVIHPIHVAFQLNSSDINQIKQKRQNDMLFKQEIEKRKMRSKGIQENWKLAEPNEIVWTDLTLKLRSWALRNQYDAFCYKNESEDNGQDSYVLINERNIPKPDSTYSFKKDIYLEQVTEIFPRFLAQEIEKSTRKNTPMADIYWSGLDPKSFWQKKNLG